jgi:hypothetical protein
MVPKEPNATDAEAVKELYDVVNGGDENDLVVLRARTFLLPPDRGPLCLKRGMVLQGASQWETFDPNGPPSSVQPGTESVIDGTNLSLKFPWLPEDSAEGVIEVAPGNRLANVTVRGEPKIHDEGGSAVVLIRPAPQGASGGRVIIQDVVIDGGYEGCLALHRFAEDDSVQSVIDIERSIIRNAYSCGIVAVFWQGVNYSRFHITVDRCRLAKSGLGLGGFTSAPKPSFAGVGDTNNEAMMSSSNSIYEENRTAGAIFLPRLGANDNRFRFTSHNDVFAGNGAAVVAYGSGFPDEDAPSNKNEVVLHLLHDSFNQDIIKVGGTRESEPAPYPGTGNRVDLLIRQGKSDLPSEDAFLWQENKTESNSVQLIGGHIQVEYGS